ncbi:Chaperone protein dnaJ 11, chloroplastic [Sesamum alatum]|uniref:Chaperone protein dnaJ 11, chloroplastic n=1 Tax=Sesamum alatum TaxID=300844 RepID=A0AAE1XZU3_9LAMI|nr:Chaperone protein dnaJ 11, chloroplastic [Sesamum alatum]
MLGSLSPPCQPSFAVQSRRRGTFLCFAVPEVAPAVDRRSLYEVLRVKRNASQTEIKTAYRTLAKLYHPDATSRFMDSSVASATDGSDFIEIHNAYATLSDPDARAVYDFSLNVDSRRRWSTAGFPSSGLGRCYSTRRWETDQCW